MTEWKTLNRAWSFVDLQKYFTTDVKSISVLFWMYDILLFLCFFPSLKTAVYTEKRFKALTTAAMRFAKTTVDYEWTCVLNSGQSVCLISLLTFHIFCVACVQVKCCLNNQISIRLNAFLKYIVFSSSSVSYNR